MRDYIAMYLAKRLSHVKLELLSELFSCEDDARAFAEVFKHNYTAKVKTVKSLDGNYAVIAQVEERFIRSNYQTDVAAYVFANWKYNHRKP